MTKRLLIIPARSGSKRILNKNIKKFFNKPIINRSIETALKSKLFQEIHVSTDSEKILKNVLKTGIRVNFLRPKRLSKDTTPIFDVIGFVLDNYKKKKFLFDEIWSMSACSPLITKNDLMDASKLILNNPTKIVLPISKYQAPIEWAFKFKNNSNLLRPLKKNAFKIRSQSLQEKYFDTGNFICFKYSMFDKIKKSPDTNYVGLKIPISRAVDIDTLEDWNFAEKLFKANKFK
jgi:pseudaminic acid cytidylyltransferase